MTATRVAARLERSDVGALLATHCPGLTVDTIEPLGEGDFCVAFAINGAWVFRFAKHDAATRALRREAALLPRIAGQFDLRIPSPQFAEFRATPAFIGYPLVPGRALTQQLYLELPPAARDAVAAQLARFLTELHATDHALARACGVEHADYRARATLLLERARQFLFPHLSDVERAFIARTLSAHAAAERAAHVARVVQHGDLSPGHVLHDETTRAVTGIIDFGDVAIGDPAWDFVWIYEDYGVDLLARVTPLYDTQAPRDFLARIHRFSVVAAIEWTAARAEEGAPDMPRALAQLSARVAHDDRRLAGMMGACEHR